MNEKPDILNSDHALRSTGRGIGNTRRRQIASGQRHWFRITGLPGWKRAQLGMPAFGNSHCIPLKMPGSYKTLRTFLRRFFVGKRPDHPFKQEPTKVIRATHENRHPY
ncbi:MAG TPA: hypothetical protein GYA07_16215 [Verrucomicrobia bacterium]|nr:hypothetical protein [Verrucomicrobiota bacterium]HOP98715.1 hypothetical protein [Verrucomicrobiota bacterium]